MMVSPDKMPFLTLGGGYGAAIKNGRQEERGESPQRKPTKGRKTTKTKRRIAPAAAPS